MIVRDEESNMDLCFDSVKHLIDAAAIMDTGSKDKTIEVTEKYMKKNKIPGKVGQETWVDFRVNRTGALRFAEKVVKEIDKDAIWYLLFMDADNRAYINFDKSKLTHDKYDVQIRAGDPNKNPTIYDFIWLVRVNEDKKWHWFGPTRIHETCHPMGGWQDNGGYLQGGYVHSRRDGFRSKQKYTYIQDAAECMKDIKDDYGNTRAHFYAALSYNSIGLFEMAYNCYKRRSKMDGYLEEKYLALIHIAVFRILNKKSEEKTLKYLTRAIEVNNKRLEAPYQLIKYFRETNRPKLGWQLAKSFIGTKMPNGLFMESEIYNYKFNDEASILASLAGEKEWAKRLIEMCLKYDYLGDAEKMRFNTNLKLLEANQKLLTEGQVQEKLPDEDLSIDYLTKYIENKYKEDKWVQIIEAVNKAKDWREFGGGALINIGVAYYWSGDKIKCYEVNDYLIDRVKAEYGIYSRALSNRKFAIPQIKDNFTNYPKEIVENIKKGGNGKITLTITTCKRFDLFEKTMNSFLQCCTDLDKIDEWLCIDDNSGEEDKKKMSELYPFFTFVFKDAKQKGHPKSMNIIHNTVKTPYIFHMEDDWQFFMKKDYVTRLLDILHSDDKLIQALINQNYAETADDMVTGGFEKWSKNGFRYREHEYTGKPEGHRYWPGFSFRPALHRKKYWDNVGQFNETTGHFEMEYANRVLKEGYKTAFMPATYCLHIGKLTSEKDKPNAYTLNNEKQF